MKVVGDVHRGADQATQVLSSCYQVHATPGLQGRGRRGCKMSLIREKEKRNNSMKDGLCYSAVPKWISYNKIQQCHNCVAHI